MEDDLPRTTHAQFVSGSAAVGALCGGCSAMLTGTEAAVFVPGFLYAVLVASILSLATSFGVGRCVVTAFVVSVAYPSAGVAALFGVRAGFGNGVAQGLFSGLLAGLTGGLLTAAIIAALLPNLPDRFFRVGIMAALSGLIGALTLPLMALVADATSSPILAGSVVFIPWQAATAALIGHWGRLDDACRESGEIGTS